MIRHTCNPFHATEAEVAACPGCQAGDTYEGWRARAEALAGALDAIAQWRQRRDLPIGEWAVAGAPIWERAEAALARLPAQALAERLRGRFNVAVAELDHQESWQRAQVGESPIWPFAKPRS